MDIKQVIFLPILFCVFTIFNAHSMLVDEYIILKNNQKVHAILYRRLKELQKDQTEFQRICKKYTSLRRYCECFCADYIQKYFKNCIDKEGVCITICKDCKKYPILKKFHNEFVGCICQRNRKWELVEKLE